MAAYISRRIYTEYVITAFINREREKSLIEIAINH